MKIFLLLLISTLLLCTITDASPAAASEEDDYDEDYLLKEFLKQQASKGENSKDSSLETQNVLPSSTSTTTTTSTTTSTTTTTESSLALNAFAGGIASEEQDVSAEHLKEKSPCVCVKYFLCNIDNGTVIDDGNVAGLIDIRLGTKGGTKSSPCPHYFDICCQSMREPVTEINRTPDFKHSACGKRNVDGVGFRITGATDQEAQFGEFPWMAAIVTQERQASGSTLNVFVCGGSLIHPRVILTAAHCIFNKSVQDLKVRLGEWDTQTPDELYPHVDRYVVKVIIHDEFYPGALYNDVALLILNEDTPVAPNIDTVCLPPPNVNFDGQRCFASGWGKDSFGQEGKYQVILKKIDLPVVPRRTCENALRRTRLGPYFRLHDSFVCAGGEKGRDTCRGDGGSPMVCKLPGSEYYVQYGIVAWGIGCGDEGIPGVYVNIPKMVPWIQKKMTESKFDSSYFKIGRNNL